MNLRWNLGVFRRLVMRGRAGQTLRWLVLSLLGVQRTVPLTIDGRRIVVRTATPDAQTALNCFGGEFEEAIESVSGTRHGLVIDAGGYIGTAAIRFAEAFPAATVVTIEPSSANFAILAENVRRYPNIRPLNKALGPTQGRIDLRDRGTGAWGYTVVDKPMDRDGTTLEAVEQITVRQLLDDAGTDGIDFFKIDIEGGEFDLLSINNDWVAATRVICIELHDRIVAGCTEIFERATEGRLNRKMDGEKHLSLPC
jgi:FkbM family methyltransferase